MAEDRVGWGAAERAEIANHAANGSWTTVDRESELAHEGDLTSRHNSPTATYIYITEGVTRAKPGLPDRYNIYEPAGRATHTHVE
eukprot:3792237-Pleurochrysis_carterae.AAC.1